MHLSLRSFRRFNERILKEDTGYSATAVIDDDFIASKSETIDGLKTMILEAVNLAFQDRGYNYTIDNLKFEYDINLLLIHIMAIKMNISHERFVLKLSLFTPDSNL